MKCLIFSDPHWCQNSSIVRSRGNKYSTRLENLIDSLNWVEQLAWSTGCDCIVCCGDFFDSYVLNSEEVSALQEIQWSPISHVFLTGNHETNVSSLDYSTTDLFALCPNVHVVNTPQQYFIDGTDVEFCFLPYVLERDRRSIQEYFGPPTTKRVIFSHNDIKDVQYGPFVSTEGFEVSDIEQCCDLYFNGHIHRCCTVTSKIVNVGNLTGQNFTEDALDSQHCAILLDTTTMSYKFYQNLYALKFYKIDASECATEEEVLHKLNDIQSYGVATVTVDYSMKDFTRSILDYRKAEEGLVEYRLILKANKDCASVPEQIKFSSPDHIKQFETYVKNTIGTSDLVLEELQFIMR